MATTHTSAGFSYHGTTDGAAADDITLDAPYPLVQVVNRDATTAIAVAIGTGHSADAFPTMAVGGEGTVLIQPGAAYTFTDDKVGSGTNRSSRVKVLSAVAAVYSVYGRLA